MEETPKWIIGCRGFYRQNMDLDIEKVCESVPYKTWRDALETVFSGACTVSSAVYEGWEVDDDHPGYLIKHVPAATVRFPHYLAGVAPSKEFIEQVWYVSRQVKTRDNSVLCLSGSTTSLSAIRNFSDLDFCEYVYVDKDDDCLPDIFAKAVDNDLRYCMEIELGPDSWARPFNQPLDYSGVSIDPADEDRATGKIDYIIDQSRYSSEIRVSDASNILIFCDGDGNSAGKQNTFAMQEVILDSAVSVPNDLSCPFELGRYIDWLVKKARECIKEGNITKACKRALSLSRVCQLQQESQSLTELGQRNVAFIDHEIAAIVELIGDLKSADLDDIEEQISNLESAVSILELEKERVQILNDAKKIDFEVMAVEIIENLLQKVDEVSGVAAAGGQDG